MVDSSQNVFLSIFDNKKPFFSISFKFKRKVLDGFVKEVKEKEKDNKVTESRFLQKGPFFILIFVFFKKNKTRNETFLIFYIKLLDKWRFFGILFGSLGKKMQIFSLFRGFFFNFFSEFLHRFFGIFKNIFCRFFLFFVDFLVFF